MEEALRSHPGAGLPDALVAKLRKVWAWTAHRGEGLQPESPVFCALGGRRISPRLVQFAWRAWQRKAGFDRLYPFHALRHTAVTNVYPASPPLAPFFFGGTDGRS